MAAKLTPWFQGSIKPARPGVYQQHCGNGIEIGYQRWDGQHWYCWAATAEKAETTPIKADPWFQNDPWRGLAEEPKGGAQ